MDHTYQSNVSQSKPNFSGYQAGYPQAASPTSPATIPGPGWFYMITEELRNVLLAGGVIPDAFATNQVSQAISLVAGAAVTQAVGPFTGQINVALANAASAQSAAVTAQTAAASAGSAVTALALPAGGNHVGFDGTIDYAAATLGWSNQLNGVQLEWFYLASDAGDYAPAFARACAALLLLTNTQYADSMGQGSFGYGVSRRLNLAGRKYMTNSPLVIPAAAGGLPADISIYGFGGGFYPGPAFPDGNYILDTGANPYGGSGDRVTIDGQDRNVKGILFHNVHHARWDKLSVVSCRNDGIVYAGGAELTLTNFEVSGSGMPNSMNVAGLRVQSSDGHFTNGVLKYTPIGVNLDGGGNNEFVNIHPWGLYASFRMYLPFYAVNSVRNTFIGCYADSPAKQDYSQDNLVVLNGIPNGGLGWFFDTNSTQNTVVASRGYVSTTAWSTFASSNSISGNHFYLGYSAAQYNQFIGANYNYAGNWLGDWRFSSDAVRDNCLVLGSPSLPNGVFAARLAQVQTAAGAGTYMQCTNSDMSANAGSSAVFNLNVGATTPFQVVGTYGVSGSNTATLNVGGVQRLQWTSLQTNFSNSNVNEGDRSVSFADGLGSFGMLSLYRNNGTGAPSGANSVAKFGTMTGTNRSISAAGTVNVGGSDYAEYMRKRDDCGLIAKGQVVGIDSDGMLTDKWALAHSFVVKSTDPSYVGGDSWGTRAALGLALEADDATHASAVEEARAHVDRIAFCGQVPCIVSGPFAVGDYIIPAQDADGIKAVASSESSAAVGKVWAVRNDGRAWIKVL